MTLLKSFVVLMVLMVPLISFGEKVETDLSETAFFKLEDEIVTTATKSKLAVSEAPAIISVLTHEQLHSMGASNLYEALSYIPGVVLTESYFGYSMVNFRGILQTHYNNKALMLINGHPMREVANGSFHFEIVPLEAIKKIEIIRGPGSALYGTNAFAGVINIITYNGKDFSGYKGDVAYGAPYNTGEGSFTTGNTVGDVSYFASTSFRFDRGFPMRISADEKGNSGIIDYKNHLANVFGSVQWKDFTFETGYFYQAKRKFGITPVLAYTGDNKYHGAYFDIRWDRRFLKDFSVMAKIRYDIMRRDFDIGHFPADGWSGHANADTHMVSGGDLVGLELQASYDITSYIQVLTGLNYEYQKSQPYEFLFKDDGSTSGMSAYLSKPGASNLIWFGQGLYNYWKRSSLVLGFLLNYNTDSKTTFVPRAGIVQYLGIETFVKVLFSQAFRNPDFFEKNVSTYGVLYGSQGLNPEKINTLDVGLESTVAKVAKVKLNGFYIDTDKLITRAATSDPTNRGANASDYVNSSGQKIYGFETSVSAKILKGLEGFFTYAFKTGKNKSDDSTIQYIAKHTSTFGLKWNVFSWFFLNPNIQYIDARTTVPAVTLFNLKVDIPIMKKYYASLNFRNIANKTYQYPEYIRGKINGFPANDGFTFEARAGFRF